GGGVVGDLAGFVAATLLRGITFVQVPSTLLSMVDSSVGGKVAVNVNTGKNMVGAFYQPKLVYSNLNYLQTLPPKEWICGLAEMVKHSFLTENESIYASLVESAKSLQQNENKSAPFSWLEPNELAARIRESVSVKAAIVAEDETEQGIRATLNLGHTTAHAIESLQHYTGMTHGEAVSRGLVTALYLSKNIGLSDQEFESMIELMHTLGLPLDTAGFEADQLFEHTKFDKKNQLGQIRFVLLKKRGQPVWGQPITISEFRQAWALQKKRFG
ncbi:MAG: 3-dehydroquinate synthase, partial [Leptonema sp. (in: Bacteria)]|nr:3-dehydroquinate synthase [Leptonema sp. (in: bacteria)]